MRLSFFRAMTVITMFMLSSCSNMQTSSDPYTYVADKTAVSNTSATTGVSYKNVTLSKLDLNQSGSEVIVKPGSTVQATVHYKYQCSQCYKTLNNQIIVGLANRSAQACIYDGGMQGEGVAEFKLKAPAKPGKYEVRFRGLQAVDCAAALKAGWRADDSPTKVTTVGVITASRKA